MIDEMTGHKKLPTALTKNDNWVENEGKDQ